MSKATDSTPVRVERFARVYTKGPEELPSGADNLYDPSRGYYFKLYLNDVEPSQATSVLSKARERFDVELVRRVRKGNLYKERVYVDNPSEVPEGYKVHTGPNGGLYYETGVQNVAVNDGAVTRNVAVIEWDDVERGDEIVFEKPDGDEVYAEVSYIEEYDDEEDLIYVDVEGETQRARPGTYTVDEVSKSLPLAKAEDDPWQPYEGPRGGEGWVNYSTGEVRYQEEHPSRSDGQPDPSLDYDPSEPPADGYASGWTAPPEQASELSAGQVIEFWDDGYGYGEVVDAGDGRAIVETSDGQKHEVDTVTAVEESEQSPEVMGEDSEFLQDLAESGEMTVRVENPEHLQDIVGQYEERTVEFDELDDLGPWGESPGTPLHANPGAYDNSAIDVEMPVSDFKRLQEFISTEMPGREGTRQEFWDAAREDDVEQYARFLTGEEEPEDYVEGGLAYPFIEFGGDGQLRNVQEGRHRALAAEEAGYDTMPVRLYQSTDKEGDAHVGSEPSDEGGAPETLPDPDDDIERFEQDDLADDLIANTNEDHWEGWTFKRNLEPEDSFEKDVYYVGITGTTVDKGDLDKQDVIDFYQDWFDLLEDEPGLRIGGWTFGPDHEKAGKIAIDLSMAVSDKEEAVEFGEELNQESVANLYRDDFPETGGSGEPVVDTPEEVREVVERVDSLTKHRLKAKSAGMEPHRVYEGVESGRRFSGRQIGYAGMHGHSVEVQDDGTVVVDGEKFAETDTEKSGPSFSTARYSPDSDEDEEEVEKQDGANVWVYYYGPDGGEGWQNMRTGEVRYQKARPGEAPEDGDGYGEVLGDNWAPDPEDKGEIDVGADVELSINDDTIVDGTYAGNNSALLDDGTVVSFDDEDYALTAYSEESPFFDNEQAEEEYFDRLKDEFDPDVDIDHDKYGVGESLVVNVGEEPFEVPIGGALDGEDPAVLFEDIAKEIGYQNAVKQFDKPENIMPAISLPANELPLIEGIPKDEYEPAPPESWIERNKSDVDEGQRVWYEYRMHTVADVDGIWPVTEDGMEIKDDPMVPPVPPGWYEDEDYSEITTDNAGELEEGDEIQYVYDGESHVAAVSHVSNDGAIYTADDKLVFPQNQPVRTPATVSDGVEEGDEGDESDESSLSSASATAASDETESGPEYGGPSDYEPDKRVDEKPLSASSKSNHGNSLDAKHIHEMPDGSEMVHTDLDHHSIEYEDGERQMAGYEMLNAIAGSMTVEHRADFSEGWFANEMAPGVDAKDAGPEHKQALDEEDFYQMAATQVLIGNTDCHQNNVKIDEDGNLYPFDLDRAGGDVMSNWVGNLYKYDNSLDRILGELESTATALGVAFYQERVMEKAEEIAERYVTSGNGQDILAEAHQAAAEWDEDFAQNIRQNFDRVHMGDYSTQL